MIHTRIHRFPHRLRGLCGADDRYVVPSVVAIGPYHHGLPHLQEMEEVKHVVAYRLCRDSRRSVEQVHEKILSVTGEARRCYDTASVQALSDAELATMMLLDGCFLLWYMADRSDDPLLTGCKCSSGPSFLKDIFMLENQIPWLVLEALMAELKPVDADSWVLYVMRGVLLHAKEKKKVPFWTIKCLQKNKPDGESETETSSCCIRSHGKPPHLLGLLRLILMGGMCSKKREIKDGGSMIRHVEFMSSSAVDLAQIGVKVTASTAAWFPDMDVRDKTLVFGELSLSPMFVNDVVAGYLVNLAALEAVEASAAASSESDGYVVSSYLSVLAMLMDREEDVQELRRRGVLCSHFSNAQTLAFFKGFGQHLRLGYNYYVTMGAIEDYMLRRPMRIAVHRFLYNNYRIIAAVLSIAGVLVGIFKAL